MSTRRVDGSTQIDLMAPDGRMFAGHFRAFVTVGVEPGENHHMGRNTMVVEPLIGTLPDFRKK